MSDETTREDHLAWCKARALAYLPGDPDQALMSDETTREDHLAWCKARALAYLPGDPDQALASMICDLDKHPGTRDHPGSVIGLMMSINELLKLLKNPVEMRRFIEGFH